MASAEDQMKFQLYTSNTSHQREVQDLIKAGLNPVLSAGNLSGASAMSGASDSSSGSGGYGSGSSSNKGVGRSGFLGAIVDSLDPDGYMQFGKVRIPNSVVITLYDQGAQALDTLTDKLNSIGANTTMANLLNILQAKNSDESNEGNQKYIPTAAEQAEGEALARQVYIQEKMNDPSKYSYEAKNGKYYGGTNRDAVDAVSGAARNKEQRFRNEYGLSERKVSSGWNRFWRNFYAVANNAAKYVH